MKNKSLSYFINLDKFPIDEPKSSRYQSIIKEAQKALDDLLKRSDISFEQKNRLEFINKIYKNNVK